MTRRRKDATGALFDGSKSGKRIQRVYTPPEIVGILHGLWPEGIMCDPCSGPESLVDAMIRIMPPANGCRYMTKIPLLGDDGEPVADEEGDLVYIPAPPGCPLWPQRTYLNPEFAILEPWLRQFSESTEVVGLFPVRPQRAWWREFILTDAVACAWLDPIKFVGHKQTFPAPLVLAYRGDRRHVYTELVERSGIGEVR